MAFRLPQNQGEQFSWIPLTGVSDGAPFHITATTTGAAQTVHTAPSNGFDLVWIWANSIHTGNVVVSIEWTTSGVTGTSQYDLVKQQSELLIDGWMIAGGNTIKAFAGTTAVVNLYGVVKRFN